MAIVTIRTEWLLKCTCGYWERGKGSELFTKARRDHRDDWLNHDPVIKPVVSSQVRTPIVVELARMGVRPDGGL